MKISHLSLKRFLSKEPKFSALIALSAVVCMFFLYSFRTSENAAIEQQTSHADMAAQHQLPRTNLVAQQRMTETEKPCKVRRAVIILHENYRFSVN